MSFAVVSKRYHTNISSFASPYYAIETSSWKLPESVRKAGVKDIKVVDDWLIFMDSDTNLPYKCFNNKINKTWEIHTDQNGRKYYFDPNSGNESVWSIPDEIEHVLIKEQKMVPEDKGENVSAADLQNEILQHGGGRAKPSKKSIGYGAGTFELPFFFYTHCSTIAYIPSIPPATVVPTHPPTTKVIEGKISHNSRYQTCRSFRRGASCVLL